MNRLEYTAEPTETITITTPLGNTHHINVWLPVGERTPAVMVEVPVCAPVLSSGIRAMIVDYMQANDADNHGLTCWQIADAIAQKRAVVRRSLQDNRRFFVCSSKKVTATYTVNNGAQRALRLPLWHLRKEAE